MRIVRAPRPDHGFLILRNETARDCRLSFRASGLLAHVLSLPDNAGTSAAELAEKRPEGREAIKTAFAELERHGYAVVTRQQDARGRWSTTRTVYDVPQIAAGHTEDGFLGAGDGIAAGHTEDGFPGVGFPGVGSPGVGFLGAKNQRTSRKNLPPTAGRPRAPRGGAGPAAADDATAATAQTLVAEWIDACRQRPPDDVVGQVARRVKAMLDEGIDPADVREGFIAWHKRRLHPSTLPSIVHEVREGGPAPRRDDRADVLDRGARVAAAATAHQAATGAPVSIWDLHAAKAAQNGPQGPATVTRLEIGQ